MGIEVPAEGLLTLADRCVQHGGSLMMVAPADTLVLSRDEYVDVVYHWTSPTREAGPTACFAGRQQAGSPRHCWRLRSKMPINASH